MPEHRHRPSLRRLAWSLLALPATLAAADVADTARVGLQADGSVVVPTNQVLRPYGRQVAFPGRPVDVALVDGGALIAVKNMSELTFVDPAKARVAQTLASNAGGFSATGLVALGDRLLVTCGDAKLLIAARADGKGPWKWTGAVAVGSGPTGIAAVDAGHAWVATSRSNDIALVDLAAAKVVARVGVGRAPYGVAVARDGTVFVSNWGGDAPAKGDPQSPSAGSMVRIDPRTGVADDGTVSVVVADGAGWKRAASIRVGLHPCALALAKDERRLFVANANSDTVSVIDVAARAVVETIDCRPRARLPFGSGANALALSRDGASLYVADGTNNCVAVIRLGAAAGGTVPGASEVVGLIPVGWYPGALALSADGKGLIVANVKGVGALAATDAATKGRTTHQFLGTLSLLDLPDAAQLKRLTTTVEANDRIAYAMAGLEPARAGVAPTPVPERHGEPSAIRHVVYVIKENRTYDQVLGDLKEGDGDPRLLLFGEEVTPNQHALARQFTLFDDFFCSGTLSADGHSWVNAAYCTDYLEKQFGAFVRSYPYKGEDALAFPATGFLWDDAQAHGRSVRDFGEFTALGDEKWTWSDAYADYRDGTAKVRIAAHGNVPGAAKAAEPTFPGWALNVPDVYRAKVFLAEFAKMEQADAMPDLTYVYLPANHTHATTPGWPTPRAMVADNDLALGRIVEAITRSRFWPTTCVFVVEDDPQAGFDHVDGHRTVALAISPYTRRGFVDHTDYNQTSMVKTIELMLGIPPMNQLDLTATAMRRCFQPTADLAGYACLPNRVPLDEMNAPTSALEGRARAWAESSQRLDFSAVDRADEDTLNRILWFSARGEAPYPEASACTAARAADGDEGSAAPADDDDD